MTTKYRCVNCDHVFELGEADGRSDEPRCPKCHRVHDVVRVVETSVVPWYRRGATVGVAALLGVLGIAVVVYVLRVHPAAPAAPAAPAIPAASRVELAAVLAKTPGAPGAELLAGPATGPAEARARALGSVLRSLADRGTWKVIDIEAPAELADRELLDPAPLLGRLGQAPPTVTSLEAALVALRLARAAGLPADVVRVERYDDRNAPADPSGLFGHYAVQLRGSSPALLLDPTVDGGVFTGTAQTAPITDGECGGVLEAYRALKEFLPRRDRPQPGVLEAKDHLDKAKQLAPHQAAVRMTAAFVAMAQDPSSAFGEIDELLRDATPSQKVAVAEMYVGMGRVADVEALLAEADKVYPGWARIPLVRGQLALFRASALATAELAKDHPEALPADKADQLRAQLKALGLSDSDRADDQFALLRRYIGDAEQRGGSRSTGKLKQMYAASYAQYRLAKGDVDGARKVLEDANVADPTAVLIALPLAAVMIVQNDSLHARKVLEPAAAEAKASVDDLMHAADQMADQIRSLIPAPAAAAPTASPFDLSAPAAPGPTTDPSLQMPSLGPGHSTGLGQGLQLHF